jgi:hypothetical protein
MTISSRHRDPVAPILAGRKALVVGATPYARRLTGDTVYVDGGISIVA